MEENIQETNTLDDGNEANNWTDNFSDADLRNNPTLNKYESQEAANRGHLELQKSMGMDKVAWPKDDNDSTRWAEVNKRLGVPELKDGYDLKDVANPEGVQLFDKLKFQEMMHESGATQKTAAKLWNGYTDGSKAGYDQAQKKFQDNVDANKAALMSEWGSAYEGNIEMGQRVIDTLSDSQEQNDFLTAQIAQSPHGSKFLAKIGKSFSESSIGGFQENANFTLSPKESQAELDRIKASPDYQSSDDRIRQPLIDRVLELRKMANPGR